MFVVKRGESASFLIPVPLTRLAMFHVDGRKENVMFDKITSRISKLCYGLNLDFIEPVSTIFSQIGRFKVRYNILAIDVSYKRPMFISLCLILAG